MLNCTQFVNSDEFAKGLSPFNPEKVSIQASRYMLKKIRYLLKRNQDFAVETTLLIFRNKLSLVYFFI